MGIFQREQEEALKQIEEYRSGHYRNPSYEAYEFNIKIYKIWIPERVRQWNKEEDLEALVQEVLDCRLREFIDDMRREYQWIDVASQEGRSGGWLVLATADFAEYMPRAWKRLKDLQEIESKVNRAKRDLVRELESEKWWADQGYMPSSKKHWWPE